MVAVAALAAVAGDECRIAAQPELLAEERIPSWLGAREPSAVARRITGGLNRVDDPAVAGAAAEMTVEGFRDRAAIVRPAVLHQRRGADENPRDAEPALHAAFED